MLAALLLFTSALSTPFTYHNTVVSSTIDYGCNNSKTDEIQCCVYDDDIIGFIDIDACAVLDIDWDNLNITAMLELNGVVLFESTFGFDTPPELCTDFKGSNICLKFYNIDLINGELSGCLGIKIDNIEIPLGCFSTFELKY